MNSGGRALTVAMTSVALLAGVVPALPVAVLEQIRGQWAVDASATTWVMPRAS